MTIENPLTHEERHRLVRLGHDGDCSLRFAGAELRLTPAQALELFEIADAAESGRDLAARLMTRLRDVIAADSVREGSRVELHPRLDAWMMGDRFGTVRKAGRKYVHVLMDRSGKVRRITPEDLTIIREA